MGAVTVARLQGVKEFREDMALAKRELQAIVANDAVPARDCAGEAEALSHGIPAFSETQA